MKVSIIIPAHNEEAIIRKTIAEIIKTMKNFDYEIIAVDDNSTDLTGKILDEMAKRNKKIKIVHKTDTKPLPSGMGSALIAGFKVASGEILIPFMGDLSDNPADIIKLIDKIEEGYDVVCGSRFIEGGSVENYPLIKLMINRFWNNVFAFLFKLNVKDISNAFKAYRKEVIAKTKPKSKGFEITAEIVLKARIMGLRITEVPVSWRGREKGKSKFVMTKMPEIGYRYGMLGLKLWLKFLSKSFSRIFKF